MSVDSYMDFEDEDEEEEDYEEGNSDSECSLASLASELCRLQDFPALVPLPLLHQRPPPTGYSVSSSRSRSTTAVSRRAPLQLQDLAPELLFRILSHLDLVQLILVSRVCRLWQAVVVALLRNWRILHLTIPLWWLRPAAWSSPAAPNKEFIPSKRYRIVVRENHAAAIRRSLAPVSRLSKLSCHKDLTAVNATAVDGSPYGAVSQTEELLADLVTRSARTLKSLDCGSGPRGVHLRGRLDRLQSLVIRSTQATKELAIKAPNLTKLVMGVGQESRSERRRRLKQLDYSHTIVCALPAPANLRVLVITPLVLSGARASCEMLVDTLVSMTSLMSLTLDIKRSCTDPTAADPLMRRNPFIKLIYAFPKLESLELRGESVFHQFNLDQAIGRLVRRSSGALTAISLSNGVMSRESVVSLSQLANLKSLILLPDCWSGLTTADVMRLLRGPSRRSLTCVRMRHSSKLDGKEIEKEVRKIALESGRMLPTAKSAKVADQRKASHLSLLHFWDPSDTASGSLWGPLPHQPGASAPLASPPDSPPATAAASLSFKLERSSICSVM